QHARESIGASLLEYDIRARDLRILRGPILFAEGAVLIVAQRAGDEQPLIEAELLLDILAERVAFRRPLTGGLDRAGVDARDARREDVGRVERSIESVANELRADGGLRFDTAGEL